AHQQSRKADRLLVAGKYEEAIACHGKAAGLLEEAITLTQCEQAQLSLVLQRDSHIKQQRLIEEKWKRARREGKPRVLKASSVPSTEQVPPSRPQPSASGAVADNPEREYDTWLYLLQNKGPSQEHCPGSKALKDDKTRLEEQETAIAELRKLVDDLLAKNERLMQENLRLQAENARLKREPYADADLVEGSELWVLPEERKSRDIPIPHLPPLEMPTQDISMELPEDIRNELQELLDRDML
ncbi:nuclear receptor-binding factor 2-like, partial [Scleropages formosus]